MTVATELGAARRALHRGTDWLLRDQDEAGWWWGRMRTNVSLDAEDLFLRELLGVRDAATTAAAARWIRSEQREDGSWATFPGGPGELSVGIEAYVALRLAGDDPAEEHMVRAARYCRDAGGIEASRMATRTWLAVFGQWPWDELPALLPELALVPTRAPLSLRDFSGWSRIALLPLALVNAFQPVHHLPWDVPELCSHRPAPPLPVRPWSTGAAFVAADRLLRRYRRRPPHRLRAAAVRRAVDWITDHQEADGSWLGVHLLTVFCLLGLWATGRSRHHPVVRLGLRSLDRFEVWDDERTSRRMECVTGPVWDTSLAVLALRDAGLPADDPAVQRAAGWLVSQEVAVAGDWRQRRPQLPAGGAWAFSFDNDLFPDCDDTSAVVSALSRAAGPDRPGLHLAVERGVGWLRGMQSRNGGWASYDADNVSPLAAELPFCDFGEATDPPSADVTAHVVECLAALRPPDDPVVRAGVAWLLRAQEPDGSWFGRWGANHVYGTGAAVPALVAAGVSPADPPVARAVRWLLDHQGDDGGWGEDLRSYTDPRWRGRGASTPSQTSWALIALHAAGRGADDPAVAAGVRWLAERQHEDGTWDEDVFTGTGFPGDFYMGYPLYRQVFPVMALGRLLADGVSAPR